VAICRIEMRDTIFEGEVDRNVSVVEVRKVSAPGDRLTSYVVKDKSSLVDEWSESVSITNDSVREIVFDSDHIDVYTVPYNVDQLLNRYQMEDSGTVSFKVARGSSCSTLEKSLAYFFVVELFYRDM